MIGWRQVGQCRGGALTEKVLCPSSLRSSKASRPQAGDTASAGGELLPKRCSSAHHPPSVQVRHPQFPGALVSKYSEVDIKTSHFCFKHTFLILSRPNPLVDAGAAPYMSGLPSPALQSLPPARAYYQLEEWRLLGAYDPHGGCRPAEVECTSPSVQSTPLHPE